MDELLRKEAQAENPRIQFRGVTTQAQLVNRTIAQDRMLAQLSGFFGFVAAALVCLGLYEITSHEAGRGTAEIGDTAIALEAPIDLWSALIVPVASIPIDVSCALQLFKSRHVGSPTQLELVASTIVSGLSLDIPFHRSASVTACTVPGILGILGTPEISLRIWRCFAGILRRLVVLSAACEHRVIEIAVPNRFANST